MSLSEYTKQISTACYLDKAHPVREWEGILKNATEIKKWLNTMSVKAYHIESERIDLTITPGKSAAGSGFPGIISPALNCFCLLTGGELKALIMQTSPLFTMAIMWKV